MIDINVSVNFLILLFLNVSYTRIHIRMCEIQNGHPCMCRFKKVRYLIF
jgi:hypothetical protein